MMNNLKHNLILICFLFSSIITFAQAPGYEPIDDTERLNEDAVDNYSEPIVNNIVKTSLFQLIRGELPVLYEFRMGNNFSLELGGGITFYNTIGRMWDLLVTNTNYSSEYIDGYQIGPHAQASMKYFFGANAVAGWFTGVNYRYSMFRYKYTPYEMFFPFNLNTQYHDGSLLFGYQNLTSNKKLFFEWYAGVGMKARYDKILVAKSTPYYNTYAVGDGEPRFLPSFKLGLKLGFSLGK